MPWAKIGMGVMPASGFFGLSEFGLSAVVFFVIGFIMYVAGR